jgi:hypothetical protein
VSVSEYGWSRTYTWKDIFYFVNVPDFLKVARYRELLRIYDLEYRLVRPRSRASILLSREYGLVLDLKLNPVP